MPTEQYENIKSALLSIGFSADAADKQIGELSEVIQLSVVQQIVAENENDNQAIAQDPEGYIKSHYDAQSLADMTAKVSGRLVSEYFAEITKDLPEAQRTEFFVKIGLTQ